MSNCIEIIQLSVRVGKEDQLLSIESVRFAEMRKRNANLERRMFKVPFTPRTYAICTTWPSREDAVRYAGERFQRDRFQGFLSEIVENFSVHFVEEFNLDTLEGVDDSVLSRYAG